jgi:hypothetical protein
MPHPRSVNTGKYLSARIESAGPEWHARGVNIPRVGRFSGRASLARKWCVMGAVLLWAGSVWAGMV